MYTAEELANTSLQPTRFGPLARASARRPQHELTLSQVKAATRAYFTGQPPITSLKHRDDEKAPSDRNVTRRRIEDR